MELRLFRVCVGLVLLIPAIVGPVTGFLGVNALARLLQADPPSLAPSIHNSLRAVCWMFFAIVPVTIWSIRSLERGATVFRIIIGCAFVAGFARLTGCLVDGFPGVLPVVIMSIELGVMPLLFVWHRRLLRARA